MEHTQLHQSPTPATVIDRYGRACLATTAVHVNACLCLQRQHTLTALHQDMPCQNSCNVMHTAKAATAAATQCHCRWCPAGAYMRMAYVYRTGNFASFNCTNMPCPSTIVQSCTLPMLSAQFKTQPCSTCLAEHKVVAGCIWPRYALQLLGTNQGLALLLPAAE
mgnify:FL=1